jgi:hypothetical protein
MKFAACSVVINKCTKAYNNLIGKQSHYFGNGGDI